MAPKYAKQRSNIFSSEIYGQFNENINLAIFFAKTRTLTNGGCVCVFVCMCVVRGRGQGGRGGVGGRVGNFFEEITKLN